MIPVYADARRGMNTVDFGLYVYDLLSIGRSVPGHRRLSTEEALAEMPGLLADGLTGAVVYYDAQVTYVERLVVENALAAAAAGARIETHTAVEKVLLERNHVAGVEVRNTLTGERSTRHASAIINAAGPWVDRILAAAGRPLPRFLGPTKGTHIIVRPFPGPTSTACYAEARSDGRPFSSFRGTVSCDRTTDTRCDDEPTRSGDGAKSIPACRDPEHLSRLPSHSGGCAVHYCGVRPLPRQAFGRPVRSPAATRSATTAARRGDVHHRCKITPTATWLRSPGPGGAPPALGADPARRTGSIAGR